MSIDPLDRPHDQQPVPGQGQNPSQAPDPDFITDNPDIQPGNAGALGFAAIAWRRVRRSGPAQLRR